MDKVRHLTEVSGPPVRVAVAGSTGSIGTQTLDVIRAENNRAPGSYVVSALSVGRSAAAVIEQAREFEVPLVVVDDDAARAEVAAALPSITVESDTAAVVDEADVVVNGIVGFAGLAVTLETLRVGKRLALANKESLIAAGPIVQPLRAVPGAELVPVDSEHCALHQCLRASSDAEREVARLLLTASGGPFRGRSADDLAYVSVEDALAHPTWSMGPKITIDSSTLMNKGLEVIEAHELYGTPYDRIEVVVHPQSVVHSMVEFTDGSTIGQLSMPTMKLPIGYALGYPNRIATPFGRIDWTTLGRLDFEPPDLETFRCLGLAYEAGRLGGTGPAWLSAANEIAVDAFLTRNLQWNEIPDVCVEVMARHDGATPHTVDDVIEADSTARRIATEILNAGTPNSQLLQGDDAMTDQMTPIDKNLAGKALADETPAAGDFAPPDLSRAGKVKSEIIAGGAVTENFDDELAGGWKGALSMLAIFGLFVWLGFANFWAFVFVVGVVISIFLHELGHYLTARWTGMKVTQFFLFFGPRLWSFRRGETEYGVRAIPLGAFVRIIGMNRMDDVEPGDEGRTYRQKSFPRRLLVISAGSIMHIMIAIVLLFGVYAIAGEDFIEEGTTITELTENQPAVAAGVLTGDVVVAVDGQSFAGGRVFGELIRANEPGDEITLGILRDGVAVDINVVLGSNDDGDAVVGVRPSTVFGTTDHSIAAAAGNAVTDIFPYSWESTKGVVKVLNPVNIFTHVAGTNEDLSSRPTTLYGIATISDDVGESGGWAGMILLLAVLNVFVGVFNMFPLLPLDGGHAAIAGYERVREKLRGGKQRYFADVERLMPFALGVVSVLLMLMFAGLYLDITQPIG